MRSHTPNYDTLQRLAKHDLARAIELGAVAAHRARAEALSDAVRGAGLGLAQLFGLSHRPVSVPSRQAPRPSHG